jgi:Tol biopolymer transport system component
MRSGTGGDIAVKPVDGGKATILVEARGAGLRPTSWSPDGASVLFDRRQDANAKSEVWIASTRGEPAPHKLIAGDWNVSHSRFSPDGRWILFTSDESGREELYVQAFPPAGSRHMASTTGIDGGGGWTQGGREIVYAGVDKKVRAVEVSIKNGTPVFGRRLERGDLPGVVEGDVTPSGRLLIAIQEKESNATPLTLLTNWTAALK